MVVDLVALLLIGNQESEICMYRAKLAVLEALGC